MNGRTYTAAQINKFISICKVKGEPFKVGQDVIIDVKSMKSKSTGKTTLVGMTEHGVPVNLDPALIVAPSLGYSRELGKELNVGDAVFIKGSRSRFEIAGVVASKKKGEISIWLMVGGSKISDFNLRHPIKTEGWVVFDTRYSNSSYVSSTVYHKKPNENGLHQYHIVIPVTYEG